MATLQDTAAQVGGHRWLELAVWRLLGDWAATTDQPAAAVRFDVDAQHAAWRAGQWWDRLPVLADVDREALTAAPTPGLAAVVDHLSGPGAPATAVGRSAAAYRVLLPRLVAGYGRHRGALLAAATDGPVARTLAQAVTDASVDWQAGESMLQLFLGDASAVRDAAATVAALEEQLALGDPAGEAVQ